VISVLRGLPEPQARPVRRDRQDRKGQWALQDPLGRQGRLALKGLPGQRDLLARRDLPDPWVQPV
jgi:hypothetical protein